MKHYNSIIKTVTVDINPLLPDVMYFVEYSTGKTRQFSHAKLLSGTYDFCQRIHNFINTGILCFADPTITTYKNGQQNVKQYHSYHFDKNIPGFMVGRYNNR